MSPYIPNLLYTSDSTVAANAFNYQSDGNWLLPSLPKLAQQQLNPLEACLMRYFVEQLAPWVSIYLTLLFILINNKIYGLISAMVQDTLQQLSLSGPGNALHY